LAGMKIRSVTVRRKALIVRLYPRQILD